MSLHHLYTRLFGSNVHLRGKTNDLFELIHGNKEVYTTLTRTNGKQCDYICVDLLQVNNLLKRGEASFTEQDFDNLLPSGASLASLLKKHTLYLEMYSGDVTYL